MPPSKPSVVCRICFLAAAVLGIGCQFSPSTAAAPARPSAAHVSVDLRVLPATSAGTAVRELLEAFNAGDSAALARVVRERWSDRLLDAQGGLEPIVVRWLGTRSAYGPVTVDSVTTSSDLVLRAWLRGVLTHAWMEIVVSVDSLAPFGLTRVATGRGILPAYEAIRRRAFSREDALREIGTYLDQLATLDYFSGAVEVARDGRVALERSYGYANLTTHHRPTPATRFNLASVGKVFTATSIALLVRQGKLSLADTIARYLPELPTEIATRITVGQLLTHTSGLGDLGAQFDTISFPRARDYLRSFVDTMLAFPPGTSFQYSNRGYIILGAIIEAVSGERYDSFVRSRIFAPLGMLRSGFVEPADLTADDAIGYTRFPSVRGGFHPGPRTENTRLLTRGSPAGGAYASPHDLLLFAEALRRNTFGRSTGADSVFSPRTAALYGFAIGPNGSSFGHGGGHPGVSANMQVIPAGRYSFVVLSNYDVITNHVAAYIREVLSSP